MGRRDGALTRCGSTSSERERSPASSGRASRAPRTSRSSEPGRKGSTRSRSGGIVLETPRRGGGLPRQVRAPRDAARPRGSRPRPREGLADRPRGARGSRAHRPGRLRPHPSERPRERGKARHTRSSRSDGARGDAGRARTRAPCGRRTHAYRRPGAPRRRFSLRGPRRARRRSRPRRFARVGEARRERGHQRLERDPGSSERPSFSNAPNPSHSSRMRRTRSLR